MKKIKKESYRYFILFLSLLISAIYFNLLQYPNELVTGGLGGISIIINKYLNIEPSIIIYIISIILLIISYIFLGIKRTSGAIISLFIYPFFISLTKNLSTINLNLNMITISIILGILFGITSSLVYKVGFSNGGLAIISEIISKYTNFSLSKSIFIINFGIVLIGGLSLGLEKILYAGIILMLNSLIIDKVFHIKRINK